MPTSSNRGQPRISNTPTSEPFYSSFSSAPISSASYAQAPPVGSGEFGITPEQNPYAGMGYDVLPEPPGQDPPGHAVPQEAHISGAGDRAIDRADPPQQAAGHPSGPPTVEDLYRAPGNPYADHAGRPASASMPASVTAPVSTGPGAASLAPFATPPTSQPQSVPARPHAPRPARKRKGVGCLASIVILALVAFFALAALGYVLELVEDRSSGTLATVPDSELAPGQCFETLEYVSGNELQPVSCGDAHRFEVVENYDLGTGAYPGTDALSETARSICSAYAADAADELSDPRVGHYALYPSEGGWNQGDQTLTCFISIAGSVRLVGSYTDGDAAVV